MYYTSIRNNEIAFATDNGRTRGLPKDVRITKRKFYSVGDILFFFFFNRSAIIFRGIKYFSRAERHRKRGKASDHETSSIPATATTTTSSSRGKIKTRSGIVINGVRVPWLILPHCYPGVRSGGTKRATQSCLLGLKSAVAVVVVVKSVPAPYNLLFQWPLFVIAVARYSKSHIRSKNEIDKLSLPPLATAADYIGVDKPAHPPIVNAQSSGSLADIPSPLAGYNETHTAIENSQIFLNLKFCLKIISNIRFPMFQMQAKL